MRVVFMGTPEFAVSALSALAKSRHQVVAVFTRKDAPQGRKMRLFPPPVKVCAQEMGIPVYQPASIKNEKWLNILKELSFDIIIVAAYGKILPPSILNMAEYGCINVHASLLPKYRGASPITAAILNGETESGVTIMQMNEGLDTGDMLLKGSVPIDKADSFDVLHDKLSKIGAELLLKALDLIEQGNISPEKQDDGLSCYAPMIRNEDAALDFSKDAAAVSQKIRAYDSAPGAFCFLEGVKTKLFGAELIENNSCNNAGTVLNADKKGLVVGCAKGTLLVREIQLSGGKRMPVSAFLAGHKDVKGKAFDCAEDSNAIRP